jgi:TolA-binding protein
MRRLRRIYLLMVLTVLLAAQPGVSQDRPGVTPQVLPFMQNAGTTNDAQVAIQFYQTGEYEKAAELFGQLYDKKPTPNIYTYYLLCLLETHEYDKAEKLVKTQRKADNDALKYLVDLGYVKFREGDVEKAKKEYDEALKKLEPNQQQIFDLANAFSLKGENEYAIRTYKRGRELMNNSYPFSFELAAVYERTGDISGTVNEYLYLLTVNPSYLKTVEDKLQNLLSNDPDNTRNELIRKELLVRVQKEPDNPSYGELMWWYSVQQQDFSMALIQAKSLDRRLKENGERLVQLAQIASSNRQYDVAMDAYKYVMSKGKNSPLYDFSRTGLLNTRYLELTSQLRPPLKDLESLGTEFRNEIKASGGDIQSADLVTNLAHLDAFYLKKPDSAISLLSGAIARGDLTPQARAGWKLELGDILLYSGNPWDATLLYQQVYKDFKNDIIGQQAKLKNAWLSFYIGEFKWAATQADILKAATSRLISNDAIALSLLVSENYDADSGTIGLGYYARADLLDYRNEPEAAIATLDSIPLEFADHPIMGAMLFRKAEILLELGNVPEADSLLGLVTLRYPENVLADSALMRRAEIREGLMNDKAGAMQYYQELLDKYPGSVYAIDARKRFRFLRGDKPF